VGLTQWRNKKPDELSGGMQQRVGLARALAMDADILLMDEPFSALDPLIRQGLQDELLALQKKLSKTIVFVSHDLDEALKLGTRIAIMKDGRIIQYSVPEEIVLNPATNTCVPSSPTPTR
jgi:glycine betaine/proline transport system ATP-binding protein